MQNTDFTIPLDKISLNDRKIVGGKCASLGEMIQNLVASKVNVPHGFAITTHAFFDFLDHNNFREAIEDMLKRVDKNSIQSVAEIGKELRNLIMSGELSPDATKNIIAQYSKLCDFYKNGSLPVAVRSSSVHEDGLHESYAGQQDTFLNVSTIDELLVCVKKCYASLYTDRALSYKSKRALEPMGVCVQKMVRSDLASSGVMFTVDTESGFDDVVIINASYGLGELIVGGKVTPDEYVIWKKKLTLVDKKIGIKDKKMIFGKNFGKLVDTIKTSLTERESFCLTDEHAVELARLGCAIEKHYAGLGKGYKHIDVEWALDGSDGQLYIVQARAETTTKKSQTVEQYYIVPDQKLNKLANGVAVGEKIATGTVRIINSINNPEEVKEFKKGDILVTEFTEPDWEPLMRISGAIVTNKGGRTCHAAIIAREQGTPAVVGTDNATKKLKNGDVVTVSCAEGEQGNIYDGELKWGKRLIDLTKYNEFKFKTNVMFNLASPDLAFKVSRLPNRGVGLAREELIINNSIGIHPCALINYNKLDKPLQEEIQKRIVGYKHGDVKDFYVKKLAYGIAKIAVAFYPYNIIVRFSDFKSNEYRNLLGGHLFEPSEENPMIGWRGASRYYSPEFKEAFGLECAAIKYVRDVIGLTNVVVMIPFCRTVEECDNVLKVMKEYGLVRGENGLEVYLMCEIPSNVLLAEEFLSRVDGYSIGSNDLTQLTLGLDRDSHLVSHIYNERNPAVLKLIKGVIQTAKKMGKKIGICGQAPSDFPDFANFLVENEIDSISITPDSIIKVMDTIIKKETSM
jgi:pyruvate, water dikinase